MNKSFVALGYLSLIITFIYAWVFYQERVLFVDPGNQLLNMINNGTFDIFVNRKSQAINQIFPLIAIKAGLSLKAIMIIYSLSYVIVYLISYIICVHIYKNIAAGMVIAMIPIMVRTAFGHSISETWLGLCYSAIFYAMINYYLRGNQITKSTLVKLYTIGLIIILINYFIHPVTLFTLLFSLGITWISKKLYNNPHIYMIGLIILLVYMIKFLFPQDQYEQGFFTGVKKAPELLPHFKSLPLIQFFKIFLYQIYIYPLLILFAVGVIGIFRKKILLGVFTGFFAGLYVFVAAMAFYEGNGNPLNESRYIPLIFFGIIPLVELVQDLKIKKYFAFIFFTFLIIAFYQLPGYMENFHTRRLNVYRKNLEMVKTFPENKFLTYMPKTGDPYINSWGGAIETLLLSSMEGKENSKSIYYFFERDTGNMEPWIFSPNCTFLWVPWYLYGQEKQLNPKYFDLKCTAYRKIEYREN